MYNLQGGKNAIQMPFGPHPSDFQTETYCNSIQFQEHEQTELCLKHAFYKESNHDFPRGLEGKVRMMLNMYEPVMTICFCFNKHLQRHDEHEHMKHPHYSPLS